MHMVIGAAVGLLFGLILIIVSHASLQAQVRKYNENVAVVRLRGRATMSIDWLKVSLLALVPTLIGFILGCFI